MKVCFIEGASFTGLAKATRIDSNLEDNRDDA